MAQSSNLAHLKALLTEEDTWTMAEGESSGTPFFLRFRPHLQDFVNTQQYTKRLIILWNYTSEDDYLFPTPEDADVMADVEEKLIEKLEEEAQTVLAFVYTGQDRREWHWYTTDVAAAQEQLNEALHQFDQLPLELTVEEDADWDQYLSILESMEDAEDEEASEEEK
ncbi:hypothetical protein TH61_02185 [Rufibacter sp. DG15C]|uniref:DUF695 domain-containing protein n=1 Tax=Rufibacter sp. DG15C TaxID=1379909 RepID=UPI00078DFEBA|nr:DUF695 domain-containing protein [Rufibacter sp. DG15C]AMM50219.1 hypothetical protein TH61_02185 [Rufibacter sp. DG15C]